MGVLNRVAVELLANGIAVLATLAKYIRDVTVAAKVAFDCKRVRDQRVVAPAAVVDVSRVAGANQTVDASPHAVAAPIVAATAAASRLLANVVARG